MLSLIYRYYNSFCRRTSAPARRILFLSLLALFSATCGLMAHYYNIFIHPGLSVGFFLGYGLGLMLIFGGNVVFAHQLSRRHQTTPPRMKLHARIKPDAKLSGFVLAFYMMYMGWNNYLGGHFQGWFSVMLLVFALLTILCLMVKILYCYSALSSRNLT